MSKTNARQTTFKALAFLLIGGVMTLPLAGCDLTKNQLKIDRSTDMEMQDYRDAMAQRLPDAAKEGADDASIPELKPYMATPNDKMKPMPLVSVSVNQTIPLKDILYEVAEQADYDIELDPRIKGSIIFTARNRPFDEVIDKIATSAGLRYKFTDDSVKIELDTPYHEVYKINYLSYVRTNSSSISNDVAVVSGEGADTGSKFKAESKSEANFWGELDANLTQIMGVNRDAGTLRTQRDPRVTAVANTPAPVAPVEPVLLTADGEIAQGGTAQQPVQVAAPDAVLRVEPLPVEDEEQPNTSGEDPFAPRFSLNKQAGMISVFATERLHKQVSSYLDMLRIRSTAQVLIEAKVLEVALTDEFAAGIDWTSIGLFDGRLDLAVDAASTSQTILPAFDPVADPSTSLAINYFSGDLNSAVRAMSRFGTVHALASPRLTVLNNQSAVLNVAKNQVYFELDVTTTPGDNGSPPTTDIDSNIRNVPEGVLINVQPAINLDDQTISMAVRPTVTRILEYVNDPSVTFAVAQNPNITDPIVSAVPVVNVQEFDSIIQVSNGQPIVLGGLIQDRTTATQIGVPVLSEMPLVGGLFRNQSDRIEKTELVVLLKATIVEGGNTVHPTDKDLYRTFSQDRRPLSGM